MAKPASQVKSLRMMRRFDYVRRYVIAILFIVVAATQLSQATLARLSRLATTHGALINLFVSVALVGLTAFYAWVTYHMASELIDSRRAALRPLLVFSLEDPQSTDHGSLRFLDVSMKVTNVGRGAAIRTNMRCAIPYEPADKQTRIVGDVDPLPSSIFPATASHTCTWRAPLEASIDADAEDFFEVQAMYEDTDGNVYRLLASYNLQIFPTFRALRPNEEALYFLAFADRRELRTISGAMAMDEEPQGALVYHRVW